MLFFSSVNLLVFARYWHLLLFLSSAVDFSGRMRFWLFFIVVFQEKSLEYWHVIRVVREFGRLFCFIVFEDL